MAIVPQTREMSNFILERLVPCIMMQEMFRSEVCLSPAMK